MNTSGTSTDLLALYKLQQQAFHLIEDEHNVGNFDTWKNGMIKNYPTFQYWDTALSIELLVLTFVRAHREKNLLLYVDALEALVGFFFIFDHYNYAYGSLFTFVTWHRCLPLSKKNF